MQPEYQYSDFLIDLTPHPVSGDVLRYVNETAVLQSVRNLLLTNAGERVFDPNLGGNVRALLFEPADVTVSDRVTEQIKAVLETYEPRVKVVSVNTDVDEDTNTARVTLNLYLVEQDREIEFVVNARRVR